MHLLRSNLLAVVLLCITVTSCSKEDPAETAGTPYDIDLALAQKNDSQLSSEILSLVNAHRTSIGLSALTIDTQYTTAYAVDHTQYMIEQEKISHDNFGYRSEGIKFHKDAEVVGENVAYGY